MWVTYDSNFKPSTLKLYCVRSQSCVSADFSPATAKHTYSRSKDADRDGMLPDSAMAVPLLVTASHAHNNAYPCDWSKKK